MSNATFNISSTPYFLCEFSFGDQEWEIIHELTGIDLDATHRALIDLAFEKFLDQLPDEKGVSPWLQSNLSQNDLFDAVSEFLELNKRNAKEAHQAKRKEILAYANEWIMKAPIDILHACPELAKPLTGFERSTLFREDLRQFLKSGNAVSGAFLTSTFWDDFTKYSIQKANDREGGNDAVSHLHPILKEQSRIFGIKKIERRNLSEEEAAALERIICVAYDIEFLDFVFFVSEDMRSYVGNSDIHTLVRKIANYYKKHVLNTPNNQPLKKSSRGAESEYFKTYADIKYSFACKHFVLVCIGCFVQLANINNVNIPKELDQLKTYINICNENFQGHYFLNQKQTNFSDSVHASLSNMNKDILISLHERLRKYFQDPFASKRKN